MIPTPTPVVCKAYVPCQDLVLTKKKVLNLSDTVKNPVIKPKASFYLVLVILQKYTNRYNPIFWYPTLYDRHFKP